MHIRRTQWAYQPLSSIEEGPECRGTVQGDARPAYKRFCLWASSLPALLICAALLAALLSGAGYVSFSRLTTARCQTPAERKEWRSLTAADQHNYLQAVQCLAQQPSRLTGNTSRYDDFVRIHGLLGLVTHYTAAFLPWHRFFVHVHEQELRGCSGYTGPQPYWDWTLDAADLSASPIWDGEHGFGGNGDSLGLASLNGGHCIIDGRFAGIERPWLVKPIDGANTVVYEPHCIARGFLNQDANITDLERKRIPKIHHRVGPDYVGTVLAKPDFESFLRAFEDGPHNAIPLFIRGEWSTFSSPNDPVFFLHHTQVDRLWWLWQQQDPTQRLRQYSGAMENFLHSPESTGAAATDTLPMGDLVPDSTVAQYLDTTKGSLCYTY